MAEEILTTPPAFKRIWFHTTVVRKEICLNGGNPQRIKNSVYGATVYLSQATVYLSQQKWDLEDLCSGNFDHASQSI